MRIRSLAALWSLSVSIATLSACGVESPPSSRPPPSETSAMTSAMAVAGPTAVAAPATTQGAEVQKWIDLEVGDCLAETPPVDLSVVTVTVVDCSTAHAAEVYRRAAVEVNAAITDVANRECAAGLVQYTGRPVDGGPFVVTYLIDSNQDRTSNNPTPSTVICLLQAADGQPLTGSART